MKVGFLTQSLMKLQITRLIFTEAGKAYMYLETKFFESKFFFACLASIVKQNSRLGQEKTFGQVLVLGLSHFPMMYKQICFNVGDVEPFNDNEFWTVGCQWIT